MNITVDKKKRKYSTRRVWLRRLLAGIGLILIVILCSGVSFYTWAFGGYFKPSLDAQYIPIAQYLHDNPQPYAKDEMWDFSVALAERALEKCQICFSIHGMDNSKLGSIYFAEVLVNEQMTRRIQPQWNGFIFDTMPADTYLCAEGTLNPGLHTVEFRAKNSPFEAPFYVRKWGVSVS